MDASSTETGELYTTSQIVFPLLVNYISSVSVVLVNKQVTKAWPFGLSLTCIHFLTTFLVLLLLCSLKFFPYAQLSIAKVSELSLMFTLSIVLNNLSIQYNSVCLQVIFHPSDLLNI